MTEDEVLVNPQAPSGPRGWIWAPSIDPDCGEYGVFVNYDNEINIPTGGTVASGVRVILNNSFAPLPVCGHTYASSQFIGRGPTELSFQITGVGNYQLSRIQSMVEELESNARSYRKVKGAGRVNFSKNPLLTLCGIQDGIVSGVDVKTEEGYTDLYRMNISFTSDGHHMETWRQESYFQSGSFEPMIQRMLEFINVADVSISEAVDRVNSSQSWWWRAVLSVDEEFARINDSAPGGLVGRIVYGRDFRTQTLRQRMARAGNLATTPEALINTLSAEGQALATRAQDYAAETPEEIVRNRFITPIFTVCGTQALRGGRYDLAATGYPNWLAPRLEEMVTILQEIAINLPPPCFFEEGNRKGVFYEQQSSATTAQEGQPATQTGGRAGRIQVIPRILTLVSNKIRGVRTRWQSTGELREALSSAHGRLLAIAQTTFWESMGRSDFDRVFPGLTRSIMESRRGSVNPTYTDLDLPPHPTTNNILDTEADFFFFNDSEEGLLNEIGPDIVREMDQRLTNAELSFTRLASGETWRNTYLGRSRIGPDDLANTDSMGDSEVPFPMDGGPGSPLNIDIADEQRRNGTRPILEGDESIINLAMRQSGVVRSSGAEETADLRQRRLDMMRRSNMALPEGEATNVFQAGGLDISVNRDDRTHSFTRQYIQSVAEQSVVQNPDYTLTMRRAFPTFKIYFLEDDIGEQRDHFLPGAGGTEGSGMRTVMYFDDFYNYNSIKEIRLVRSRKEPTDLLVLSLTNVTGMLERRAWVPGEDMPTEAYMPGFEETELENPLKKIILKEGLKVQARLGYCVDEETEILTKRGWLKHNELQVGDIALTLNHEVGRSEWQPVLAVNRFEVADYPMISLEGNCHSSLTTLNHRWPILHRRMHSGAYSLSREWTTSEQLNTNHQIISGAQCNCPDQKIYSDAFVEIIAWFWTEGHITNTKTQTRRPGIVISQSITANPKNVQRIESALTILFGPSSDSIYNHRYLNQEALPKWKKKKRVTRDEVEFRLNFAASEKILAIAPNRKVKREFILQLTLDQLRLFIDISNRADGSYPNTDDGVVFISQKDPDALDALELAAILAGHRTRRYFSKTLTKGRDGTFYSPNTLYVGKIQSIRIDKRYVYPKSVLYTGVTWCPTTPNSSWLARRNGITHFTGNSQDPDKMGIKFIGEVVEVSYNAECSDEVTIICQSYGAELVLDPKGLAEDQRYAFEDTPDLVHTMMCSPELAHFGRFSVNPNYNPAEVRTIATSRGESILGSGININPSFLIDNARHNLTLVRSNYFMANNPADDNIYAPAVRDYAGWSERLSSDVGSALNFGARTWFRIENWVNNIPYLGWVLMPGASPGGIAARIAEWVGGFLNTLQFTPTGQTIWDIIKECELRHPGWVGHPRPYGTRMTMFFGVPTFRYWADEISPEEMEILSRLRSGMEDVADTAEIARMAAEVRRERESPSRMRFGGTEDAPTSPILPGGRPATSFWYRTWRDMTINRWLSNAGQYVGRTMGRYRPFRRYHLITSDHHILLNNMRASDLGTFNVAAVKYNGGIYTLKADDNIPDEKSLVQVFDYENSVDGETLARRYCIGLLCRHLKDVYKGEIVVTGMDIDPYDVCYIHDDRLGMYGAVEVKQVVDTFTPETGWITEITPDLIVGANEWSTASTLLARQAVLGALSQRYLGYRPTTAGTTAAILRLGGVAATRNIENPIAAGAARMLAIPVMAPGALLAWAGGYYIVRWSQDRQPIWVQPLILGDRPFLAGLDGFRQDGIFSSLRGQLAAEFDALSEGWRAFHLSSYFSDFGINWSQWAAGQITP